MTLPSSVDPVDASEPAAGKKPLFARLKEWAEHLEKETYALYFAARDPRTPWYAKVLAGLVVAYALSPIDVIPDFIPVLGYLDDVIIVPLGLALALRLIPPQVMREARVTAAEKTQNGKIVSRTGILVVVGIWLALLALAAFIVYRLIR